MKKIVLLFLLSVLLSAALISGVSRIARAEESILIRSDGGVEGTDKIQREGDIYTFTGQIYTSILAGRDNIVVDGGGYSLQGTGSGVGINVMGSNISIKNLQ